MEVGYQTSKQRPNLRLKCKTATVASLVIHIRKSVRYAPNSISLYPLTVRPLRRKVEGYRPYRHFAN